ncbi:MAG: hypothetical protein RUMPE_01076 [Eubacteriales bacterium SKADARSKE-1]|nr:hypothetical protein [Eubacteriales bacterium SKADARSKE-1]
MHIRTLNLQLLINDFVSFIFMGGFIVGISHLLVYIKKGIAMLFQIGILATAHRVYSKLKGIKKRKEYKEFHIVSKDQLEKQRNYIFKKPLTFSILTPLYNTPEQFLIDMISSVRNQTYKNFELCLADASDENHKYVEKICKDFAATDDRIKYKKLSENKGISENTNECLSLSTGDFISILDHDDILHPSAFFESMKAIEEKNADFVYTDEAKFFEAVDKIHDPNFKPGFSADELRAHNYICHFNTYSRKLLDEVGTYRSKCDGSQDHDMVLRLTEHAKSIVHISKVLYYWRVHKGSVSFNVNTKSYAVDAAKVAVSEQLERLNLRGSVDSIVPFQTLYKVSYELLENPLITIIIHSAKTQNQIEMAIKVLQKKTSYKNLEILTILPGADSSSARAWNKKIEQATGEYIIMLNAALCDIENSTWIEEMLMLAQREDVGAVGCKCCYANKTILYAGISLCDKIKSKLIYWHHGLHSDNQGYEACLCHVRNTTGLWAGCFMIKKQVLKNTGGFSDNMPEYEGVDMGLKLIEKKLNVLWTPFAKTYFNLSPQNEPSLEYTKNFIKVWSKYLKQDDLYCNPNLVNFNLI